MLVDNAVHAILLRSARLVAYQQLPREPRQLLRQHGLWLRIPVWSTLDLTLHPSLLDLSAPEATGDLLLALRLLTTGTAFTHPTSGLRLLSGLPAMLALIQARFHASCREEQDGASHGQEAETE